MHKRFALLAVSALIVSAAPILAQDGTFSVSKEIGIADFGDNSYMGKTEAITWSPDGKFVAVHVGRGLVDSNRVQSELRIYSKASLEEFANGNTPTAPYPLWSIVRSNYKEGPSIQSIKWTRDSKGIAYLQIDDLGRLQLEMAHIDSKTISPLSEAGQDVMAFDVVSESSYAYVVRDPDQSNPRFRQDIPSEVVTGLSFFDLFFPIGLYPERTWWERRGQLWAATGAGPHQVTNRTTQRPFTIFEDGLSNFHLAPNGRHLITLMPVSYVPEAWAKLYRPPAEELSVFAIRPGKQDLGSHYGRELTQSYSLFDLQTGEESLPVGAPAAYRVGWFNHIQPQWSSDSSSLIITNVFMPLKQYQAGPTLPCAFAIYRLAAKTVDCGLYAVPSSMKSGIPYQDHYVSSVKFHGTSHNKVDAEIVNGSGRLPETIGFRREESGRWIPIKESPLSQKAELKLDIRQSVDEPPVLTVTILGHAPRVVWDPNPQLKSVRLGQVRVLSWKDKHGHEVRAGLYLPPDYDRTRRYPLVIQTHGFQQNLFRPSGIFPTAMAARALAAVGIAVLQMQGCDIRATTEEGPCQTEGYEVAIDALSRDGIIDPERVGMVGFSRTCYYVLEAMTDKNIKLRAASITDGVNLGYWEYLTSVDFGAHGYDEYSAMNGGRPLGESLQSWLSRAPTFHMDKVDAPLLAVGAGLPSLASLIWEPYALLRVQHKVVELELLNTSEHVLTNPAVRLASQGGTVDWMRFWLQGYEDPAPTKVEQYRRWEALCDAQIAQRYGEPTFCVTSQRAARPDQKPN